MHHTSFRIHTMLFSAAARFDRYGFSTFRIANATHLLWRQYQTDDCFPAADEGKIIDEVWIVQHHHGDFRQHPNFPEVKWAAEQVASPDVRGELEHEKASEKFEREDEGDVCPRYAEVLQFGFACDRRNHKLRSCASKGRLEEIRQRGAWQTTAKAPRRRASIGTPKKTDAEVVVYV